MGQALCAMNCRRSFCWSKKNRSSSVKTSGRLPVSSTTSVIPGRALCGPVCIIMTARDDPKSRPVEVRIMRTLCLAILPVMLGLSVPDAGAADAVDLRWRFQKGEVLKYLLRHREIRTVEL